MANVRKTRAGRGWPGANGLTWQKWSVHVLLLTILVPQLVVSNELLESGLTELEPR